MAVFQTGKSLGHWALVASLVELAILAGAPTPGFGKKWDRVAAQKAFENARLLHSEIQTSSAPASKEKYLHCIRTYQRTYFLDPHYGASDDAVFEAAGLYQEMGERFPGSIYYKNAIKLFRFLVEGYPKSRNLPEALRRMVEIYTGPLTDPTSAQLAFDELRSRFESSEEVARAARTLNPPQPTPAESNPATGTATTSSVHNIRHWSTSDYTRVVIDIDREAKYEKTQLPDPNRIYFDILNARLSRDLLNKTFVVGDVFLKQVRVGQNRSEVVRVVLDFASISDYTVFELHDPYRIIIDIHGARGTLAKTTMEPKPSAPAPGEIALATLATKPKTEVLTPKTTQPIEDRSASPGTSPSAQPPKRAVEVKTTDAEAKTTTKAKPVEVESPPPAPRAAAPTSRGNRSLTRVLGLKIGRIVLDPGHGGHDTGTIGRNGLTEKDLVLFLARDLQKLLEDRIGAEVVLTREDDTFVPLEERTAIANQNQADLFVSIHANSSSLRSISGVETYYLDFARSRDAQEVAARENASTVRNVRDLQELVKRIAEADKSTESRELASIIQKKLYVGANKVYSSARNRGVRSAPFVVLIGANMPSILTEVGFLSNPRDEKNLKKETSRQRLAEALFAGIESYVKTLGTSVAQNNSN